MTGPFQSLRDHILWKGGKMEHSPQRISRFVISLASISTANRDGTWGRQDISVVIQGIGDKTREWVENCRKTISVAGGMSINLVTEITIKAILIFRSASLVIKTSLKFENGSESQAKHGSEKSMP